MISRVELIRKDKENFRCARKIAPSGKPALDAGQLFKTCVGVFYQVVYKKSEVVFYKYFMAFLLSRVEIGQRRKA